MPAQRERLPARAASIARSIARLLALGLPICLAVSARGEAPALFPSRVALEPLEKKLAFAGGDASRILRPEKPGDLLALESGRRYKFIVGSDGKLAIAPLPADAPTNEYVHPILAAGKPVRTAGGLRIDRVAGKITAVIVDQDSKAYCPTFASLAEAEEVLVRLGAPRSAVQRRDQPPACAPPR